MKEVLIRIVKDLNQSFHMFPVLYASFALELATGESFDAKDLDLLIPETWFQRREEMCMTLEKLGYEKVDKEVIALRIDDIEIEMAKEEMWICRAGLDPKTFLDVFEEGVHYRKMDVLNLEKLYRYLMTDETRTDEKKQKDMDKLKRIDAFLNRGNKG